MLSLLPMLILALSVDGAQISLQFTRTTQGHVLKLPSFVKGGRIAQPPTTISSVLLQVRGGGDDPYYNYNDDDYRRNNKPKRPEYGYEEEKKVEDDYYYGEQQNGRDFEGERRYADEYDDRGRRSRDNSPGFSASAVPSIIKNGDRKIGMVLLSFGAFFTISGVFLFFHKTLLRLGNLLFIAGVPMTLGPGRTAGYFLQPKKARATGFLVFGIFLVFYGWPIVGMALEIFGLLNLFGNMIPMAMVVLRQMPIVGGLFKAGSASRNKRDSRRDDDRYYDDRYGDDRYYGDDDKGGDPDRYY